MDPLLKFTRQLLWLLTLSVLAFSVLRSAIGTHPGMEFAIGCGLLGFVLWRIARGVSRHARKRRGRSRREEPQLPARAEWLSRRQEQNRRIR